jgi:hypothetical protein
MALGTPGATKVTREELASLSTPSATDTHKPVPHIELVKKLEEALAFRHINITQEEYCIAKDGSRLFGFLNVNAEYEGLTFGIGLRNAHDKSMRLGLVAGYRVTVCSNMMFSGDFKPMLAKHSKHFDLEETLSIGVDRIQRGWEPMKERVNFMRGKVLPITTAQALIYRAFTEGKFPVRLLQPVHRHYFHPEHEEFQPRTVWSLSNAFTSAFKGLRDDRRFELTGKLSRFLDRVSTSSPA